PGLAGPYRRRARRRPGPGPAGRPARPGRYHRRAELRRDRRRAGPRRRHRHPPGLAVPPPLPLTAPEAAGGRGAMRELEKGLRAALTEVTPFTGRDRD